MIQIIQENKFFIVVNKPTGVSVHNEKPSLVEFLEANKKPLHFVSRLDRETSGLLVIAKDPEMHSELAESMDQGDKTYRALLRGPWKAKTNEVDWKWALSDKAEGRFNPQGIKADRVECESHAKLVRTNKYFSEVLVTIMTGRQHQIRKHAAIADQPIVGDNRYNEKKYNQKINERYGNNRVWLHCEKLDFEFREKQYNYENKIDLEMFFK